MTASAGWKVQVTEDNVCHAYPIGDLQEHSLNTDDTLVVIIKSDCPCEPRIGGNSPWWTIIHRSFDGREAIEEVNEILNSKQ